eukprot:CAMPEP_0201564152 /NCGR_PEP_ID=MMETSP0190_2-20130828/2179_1 /ASSEMBLY_ACC=CAM_ASM_000263 /TAXON_ID=37353 /ORGANISM="Rosalina sp." /LENGTH=256 /DNA_ID=CAMNT_0047979923 /DNA_START=162 /DNA_END=929 /DNA_ORIENTATION=-
MTSSPLEISSSQNKDRDEIHNIIITTDPFDMTCIAKIQTKLHQIPRSGMVSILIQNNTIKALHSQRLFQVIKSRGHKIILDVDGTVFEDEREIRDNSVDPHSKIVVNNYSQINTKLMIKDNDEETKSCPEDDNDDDNDDEKQEEKEEIEEQKDHGNKLRMEIISTMCALSLELGEMVGSTKVKDGMKRLKSLLDNLRGSLKSDTSPGVANDGNNIHDIDDEPDEKALSSRGPPLNGMMGGMPPMGMGGMPPDMMGM